MSACLPGLFVAQRAEFSGVTCWSAGGFVFKHLSFDDQLSTLRRHSVFFLLGRPMENARIASQISRFFKFRVIFYFFTFSEN